MAMDDSDREAPADPVSVASMLPEREQFEADGFVTMEHLISAEFCSKLNARLELVLRGEFDIEGGKPDKAPAFKVEQRSKPGKKPPPLGGPSKQTLQLINVWKADSEFRRLVRSPALGKAVAELGGWSGARVANDQVWAKPPGAAPLTFHRDSAYFDFQPEHVITVWIALDDMLEELGPLEYVRASHLWDGRVGSAQLFFDKRDRHALLRDAALQAGVAEDELEVISLKSRAGGCGIHDGKLWHGSGKNMSATKPRRGLGIHFVPSTAKFKLASGKTLAHRAQAAHMAELAAGMEAGEPMVDSSAEAAASADRCATGAVESGGAGEGASLELSPELFPITWSETWETAAHVSEQPATR